MLRNESHKQINWWATTQSFRFCRKASKCICDVKKYAEKADKNCENTFCPITKGIGYRIFESAELGIRINRHSERTH